MIPQSTYSHTFSRGESEITWMLRWFDDASTEVTRTTCFWERGLRWGVQRSNRGFWGGGDGGRDDDDQMVVFDQYLTNSPIAWGDDPILTVAYLLKTVGSTTNQMRSYEKSMMHIGCWWALRTWTKITMWIWYRTMKESRAPRVFFQILC